MHWAQSQLHLVPEMSPVAAGERRVKRAERRILHLISHGNPADENYRLRALRKNPRPAIFSRRNFLPLPPIKKKKKFRSH